MNNDFTGNELHKARRFDLLKEAEGNRLLKTAGIDKPGRSFRAVALKAIGAVIAVLLIAQVLAH